MMVSSDLLNAVAQVTSERIMDSLFIGIALAALAWASLRILPRQSSATRFSVLFAVLVATALLPFIHPPASSSGFVRNMAPPLISVPGSWALYLFLAWAAIASLGVLHVGIGFLELRRLRRGCRAIENFDPGWRETLARVCPSRPVEILASDRVHIPTAIGFFHPAVVIPAGLLDELSPAELKQVLLHELAHLRRWDDWTNVVQKFVKALLFFHPAVWWMEERISLEREMACDDVVLAEISSPRAYAECLAVLAEKSFRRRSTALAQAAVNRIRQTTLRVAKILDVNRPKAVPARKSALALLGAFGCAMTVAVWHAPRLIAFQDPPPVLATGTHPPLIERPVALARTTGVAPLPVTTILKLPADHAAVIQVKATIGYTRRNTYQRRPIPLAKGPARSARVIQAKASVPQSPAVTGVLVIFVDDPVFGPTPTLWHFTVWQVPQPRQGPQPQEGAPQKSI